MNMSKQMSMTRKAANAQRRLPGVVVSLGSAACLHGLLPDRNDNHAISLMLSSARPNRMSHVKARLLMVLPSSLRWGVQLLDAEGTTVSVTDPARTVVEIISAAVNHPFAARRNMEWADGTAALAAYNDRGGSPDLLVSAAQRLGLTGTLEDLFNIVSERRKTPVVRTKPWQGFLSARDCLVNTEPAIA